MSSKVNLFGGFEVNLSSTDDDDDSLLNELAPVGDFNWLGIFAVLTTIPAGYSSLIPNQSLNQRLNQGVIPFLN